MLLPPALPAAAGVDDGVLDPDTWFHGSRWRALTRSCALHPAATSAAVDNRQETLTRNVGSLESSTTARWPPRI